MKLSKPQAELLTTRILLRKYHLARNQARFRGQSWDITKEQFFAIWRENNLWLEDGQKLHGHVFSRKNMNQGWTVDNVHIVTREHMLQTRNKRKKQTQ